MNSTTAEQTRTTLPGVCPPVAPHEEVTDCATLMDFTILGTLGEGTFGKVVKAQIRASPDEFVAIKVMNKSRLDSLGSLKYARQELDVHRNLRHPNIVEVLDVREDTRNLYLVLKWVQGLELFEIIQRRGCISEDEARPIFAQLMAAVDFLHSHGIAHRDIKLENILVDDEGCVKLIDFGLSRTYRRGDALATCCGADVFAAPEMYTGAGYDPATCDVWSCGVVLWALLTGFMPFRRWQAVSHFVHMMKNGTAPAVSATLSTTVRQMFAAMFAQPYSKRISTRVIRMHPWLGNLALFSTFDDAWCPPQHASCTQCLAAIGICVHTCHTSSSDMIRNLILPTNKKTFSTIQMPSTFFLKSMMLLQQQQAAVHTLPLKQFAAMSPMLPNDATTPTTTATGASPLSRFISGDASPSSLSLPQPSSSSSSYFRSPHSQQPQHVEFNVASPVSPNHHQQKQILPSRLQQERLTVSTIATLSSPELNPQSGRPSSSFTPPPSQQQQNQQQYQLPPPLSTASSSSSFAAVSSSSSSQQQQQQQQQKISQRASIVMNTHNNGASNNHFSSNHQASVGGIFNSQNFSNMVSQQSPQTMHQQMQQPLNMIVTPISPSSLSSSSSSSSLLNNAQNNFHMFR
eukprot:GDKJ01032996.1.p1 GENE.GDKJ01032996.1~~GDKJ01032996.1.p1  ORF type:complete len:630 (-),score=181.66 GDKJ01032996.1:2487-4376(-)